PHLERLAYVDPLELRDANLPKEGPVRAAEVHQPQPPIKLEEPRVPPRDPGRVEPHPRIDRTAEVDRRLVDLQAALFDRPIVPRTEDDEVEHASEIPDPPARLVDLQSPCGSGPSSDRSRDLRRGPGARSPADPRDSDDPPRARDRARRLGRGRV